MKRRGQRTAALPLRTRQTKTAGIDKKRDDDLDSSYGYSSGGNANTASRLAYKTHRVSHSPFRQLLVAESFASTSDFHMNDQDKHYANKLAYEIDSWDLRVAIEAGDKIVIVDARSADAYGRGHIPGAINIPHRTMSEAATAHLQRDAMFIVYCDGIGCNASTKGALHLVRLGFRVKELIGGLDWWRRDGYEVHTEAAAGGASCGCD